MIVRHRDPEAINRNHRAVADEAARVAEEIAPPDQRQVAFVAAGYAILRGEDPRRAVRYVIHGRP